MNAVALRFYMHQPRKHGKVLLFEWLARRTLARTCAGRDALVDLARHRHRHVGNRHWDCRAAPPEQILYHADSWQADHIVLGHRGKNMFRRWLMGSVSHRVLSHATCTVTIVR